MIKLITPEVAQELLKRNKSNRPVNKNTVAAYAKDMREGKWVLTPDVIGLDTDGNLMNGQHRLLAIVESNTSQEFIFATGFSKEAFEKTDQGRKRTYGDILSVRAGVSRYNNMASVVNLFIGLKKDKNIGSGNQNTRPTAADILNTYTAYSETFERALTVAHRCYKKLNFLGVKDIGGVYAHLVITKQYEHSYVNGFFEELFFNITNNPTITLLRDRLIKDKMSKSTLRYGVKLSLIAKAWNAYVANRTLKQLKYSEEEGRVRFN